MSLLSSPLLADGITPALLPAVVPFAYVPASFVLALIEGPVIKRALKWSFKRAYWAAVFANLASALVGLTIEILVRVHVAGTPVDTGLSIWTVHKYWFPIALGVWLCYYAITVPVEGFVLAFRIPKKTVPRRFSRALKVSLLFNAISYLLIAPLWFFNRAPGIHGATLVHRDQWLPEINEEFQYERPDGSCWLGNTRGEQLGRCSMQREPRSLNESATKRGPRTDTPVHVMYELDLRGFPLRLWPKSRLFARLTAADQEADTPTSGKTTVHASFYGSPGLEYALGFWSPTVLPGERYVLFECLGEIMVLDIEESKVVSLFPGRRPIALSSFEPKEDEPPIATD